MNLPEFLSKDLQPVGTILSEARPHPLDEICTNLPPMRAMTRPFPDTSFQSRDRIPMPGGAVSIPGDTSGPND